MMKPDSIGLNIKSCESLLMRWYSTGLLLPWYTILYYANQLVRSCSSDLRRRRLDQELLEAQQDKRSIIAIQFLVLQGASIAAKEESSGDTALHLAARMHDLFSMKVLLYTGADISRHLNGEQDTALHVSLNASLHFGVFARPKIETDRHLNGEQETAMELTRDFRRLGLFATKFEYHEILQFLIYSGADINARNSKGQTPLHLALMRDPIGISLFDPAYSLKTFVRNHPSHYWGNYVDVVKMLLSHGADIELEDVVGRSPLHHVAGFSVSYINEYVDLLRRHGGEVDLTKKDSTGWTPLHFACHTGNLEGVRWCVEHGSNLNARDRQGRSPLHLVCDHEAPNFLDYLKGRINLQHRDTLAMYLQMHGCDQLARTNQGETPFSIACRRRQVDTMRAVCGDDVVNVSVNGDKETCLHIECRQRNGKSFAEKLLFSFFADPNIVDGKGRTALDTALSADNLDDVPFLVYRRGTSKLVISPKKLYKIYKSCTESFVTFLKQKAPLFFTGPVTTKTLVKAAQFISRDHCSIENHAHLFTAIKFRNEFTNRLKNGGDAGHKHFVKVLQECESILFLLKPQSGFEAQIVYTAQSAEQVRQHELGICQLEFLTEDEMDYPIEDFLDDSLEAEMLSIDTSNFFCSND